MCGCGGVIETAAVAYLARKVYQMSTNTSTSCRVCGAVAIPDDDICPECLIAQTSDLDALDPFVEDGIPTLDLDPTMDLDVTDEDGTRDIDPTYVAGLSLFCNI